MIKKFKKRIIISSLLSFLLVSCASWPSNVAGNFNQTFKAFSALIYGYEDFPINQALIDQIPYASLRMKIGKGPAGLLILESVDKKDYTWVSTDDIYITIRNGRIIRAQGLPNNLLEFYSTEPSFEEILNNKNGLENYFRYITLDNPEVFDLRIRVSYRRLDSETVFILDEEKELVLIEEMIENNYIRWRHTNKYWVDQNTGFVWQSIQEIAPNVPPIFIQITKKPS